MTKAIPISEITDAMQEIGDEVQAYFDRETGKVEVVRDEERSIAEDEDVARFVPEWQRELVEIARLILADEESGGTRFVALPDRFEIDEWSQMQQFAAQAGSAELDRALQGSGAFRRFKDTTARVGLIDRWYAFRDEQFRQIAREWCEENGIEIAKEERV